MSPHKQNTLNCSLIHTHTRKSVLHGNSRGTGTRAADAGSGVALLHAATEQEAQTSAVVRIIF